MNIIVTGGAGFIGSNFVFHMLEKGEFSTEIAYERGYGLTYSALQPLPDPHKEDKKQGSVDTGDDSTIMLYSIILLISLMGIVCMIWSFTISNTTRRK